MTIVAFRELATGKIVRRSVSAVINGEADYSGPMAVMADPIPEGCEGVVAAPWIGLELPEGFRVVGDIPLTGKRLDPPAHVEEEE